MHARERRCGSGSYAFFFSAPGSIRHGAILGSRPRRNRIVNTNSEGVRSQWTRAFDTENGYRRRTCSRVSLLVVRDLQSSTRDVISNSLLAYSVGNGFNMRARRPRSRGQGKYTPDLDRLCAHEFRPMPQIRGFRDACSYMLDPLDKQCPM